VAHVDELNDAVVLQQINELVQRAGRMPDSENARRL